MSSNFSSLNDDNITSSNFYSTIDSGSISDGVPKWNEENDNGKTLDLDKLQAERAELDLGPKRQ